MEVKKQQLELDVEQKTGFKLGKETDIQVQKAQKAPNKMNPNRTTPRHTATKMTKIKGVIFYPDICLTSSRDGNTRPPDLPLEKFVCRSGSNS